MASKEVLKGFISKGNFEDYTLIELTTNLKTIEVKLNFKRIKLDEKTGVQYRYFKSIPDACKELNIDFNSYFSIDLKTSDILPFDRSMKIADLDVYNTY